MLSQTLAKIFYPCYSDFSTLINEQCQFLKIWKTQERGTQMYKDIIRKIITTTNNFIEIFAKSTWRHQGANFLNWTNFES